MNLLGYGKYYTFHSSLSSDECIKILTNSIENKINFNDVLVKINGNKFQIFRKTDYSNSSYNPVYYGRLVKVGDGSRIEGYFSLSTISLVITIFLFLWIIVLPLFAMKSEDIWKRILLTLVTFSCGSLITVVNLLWGKWKMKLILDFIQHELQAVPTKTPR